MAMQHFVTLVSAVLVVSACSGVEPQAPRSNSASSPSSGNSQLAITGGQAANGTPLNYTTSPTVSDANSAPYMFSARHFLYAAQVALNRSTHSCNGGRTQATSDIVQAISTIDQALATKNLQDTVAARPLFNGYVNINPNAPYPALNTAMVLLQYAAAELTNAASWNGLSGAALATVDSAVSVVQVCSSN